MNDVWLKELAEEQTKRLLEYYIKLRKQHKLSQSELERITGVSRISINRYENGKIIMIQRRKPRPFARTSEG